MRFKENTDVIIATTFFQVKIAKQHKCKKESLSWFSQEEMTFHLFCIHEIKFLLLFIKELYIFSQELVVVGSTGACAKAPHCIWSPIPPPELRGEPIEDLSTNGGFVSFGIKLLFITL